MILDIIKDALKDHIILHGYGETDYVYDEHSCAEVKSILDDHHIANCVLIYPTNTNGHDEPDYWCCASWMEAGQLQSYGWNWMSALRVQALEAFNKVGDLYYNGSKAWM